MAKPRPLTALVFLVITLCACASRPGSLGDVIVTPDQLLSGRSLGLEHAAPASAAGERDVLALTPEMQEFLDSHVNRGATGNIRLHQLVAAVIDSGTFGLEYDDVTRTASETFRLRTGNCLSFSNMFLAMARNVGLDAQYQEVDVPPDWTLDKETFVLSRHINIHVNLGVAGTRVVDFNIGDFRTSYDMRKISDARALAHYYNNIGVESMQAGDTAAAFYFFRKAIAEHDRLFSPAWTNLGILYGRNGLLAYAEAAHHQALKVGKSDLVALSNLARLYERRGDPERAAACRKKVMHHRMHNPYYRYNLARDALAAGDWRTAIGHLKFAMRKRPKEDRFCFQLGRAYLLKGDENAAQRWFARARELAATNAQKQRYSGKIEALLRRGGDGGRP
jgi:Flp pilus assembly protein TadD